MTRKYSNGMYKTTSKDQNKTAQLLFNAFEPKSMGMQFDQLSGNCVYDFDLTFNHRYITVDLTGKIIANTVKPD